MNRKTQEKKMKRTHEKDRMRKTPTRKIQYSTTQYREKDEEIKTKEKELKRHRKIK